MNIGFKHFTSLQWCGVFSFISLIGMLISIFVYDIKPTGWLLALISNVVLVVFAILFISWPGKHGFQSRAQDEGKYNE